jgi:hypothetical protein
MRRILLLIVALSAVGLVAALALGLWWDVAFFAFHTALYGFFARRCA